MKHIKGVRKFLIMLIVLITAIVFTVKGLINSTQFIELIKSVGIAFMSANLGENVTKVIADKLKK